MHIALALLVALTRLALSSMQGQAPASEATVTQGLTGSDFAGIAGILVLTAAIVFFVRLRARKLQQGGAR